MLNSIYAKLLPQKKQLVNYVVYKTTNINHLNKFKTPTAHNMLQIKTTVINSETLNLPPMKFTN